MAPAANGIAAADTDWYETRWRWLFRLFVFDPKLQKIICSETSVDTGGVGRLAQQGATDAWWDTWLRA